MRRRAFTLIELLVVIAIIAILLSVLLPVLGRTKESGRASICAGNLRQLATAWQNYLANNRDAFPYPFTSWCGGQYNDLNGLRQGLIYPYAVSGKAPTSGLKPTAAEKVFLCPTWRAITNDTTAVRNYSANVNLGVIPDIAVESGGVRHMNIASAARIRQPSIMLVVTEENTWHNAQQQDTGLNDAFLFANNDPPHGPDAIASYHFSSDPNQGLGQAAFLDGHVRTARWSETKRLVQGEFYPW